MAFEGMNINDIAAQHLVSLIGVAESRDLDFKQETYGNADRDKKEFLADISSFANTIGGHILIGISEVEGNATAVEGITIDADAEIQRLESIALHGLQPRIIGLQVVSVALANGKRVLIIQVPRSWNGPHRIVAQSSNRFYLRAGSQKYEPDVEQLRQLFTGGTELAQRMRDFQYERVGKIAAQAAPLPMMDRTALVLHIIPFSAFSSTNLIDLNRILAIKNSFLPMRGQNMNWRINLDGLLCFTSEVPTAAYSQVWKNGCIEAVRCHLVREHEGRKTVGLPAQAANLIKGCKSYLAGLKSLGVPAPISIFVTMLGAAGSKLAISAGYFEEEEIFDRDQLFFTEIILDEYPTSDADIPRLLHPVLTQIANAAGYETAPEFDASGNVLR